MRVALIAILLLAIFGDLIFPKYFIDQKTGKYKMWIRIFIGVTSLALLVEILIDEFA